MSAEERITREAPPGRRAFGIVAVVFGLVFGGVLFGFPSLVLGWFETGERQIHRIHDIGGGILTGVLFAVGFFAMAPPRRRLRVAPLHQVAVATVALAIAAGLAADATWLIFVAIGGVALAALLALGGPQFRRSFFAPERRPSPVLATLALAATVPATAYALSMAALQRHGLATDPHVEEHHWTQMASMALALILVGLLASLRMPGWRVPARCAALGAMLFGLASTLYPNYAGSAGANWGLAVLIGGAVFFVVAEVEARGGTAAG